MRPGFSWPSLKWQPTNCPLQETQQSLGQGSLSSCCSASIPPPFPCCISPWRPLESSALNVFCRFDPLLSCHEPRARHKAQIAPSFFYIEVSLCFLCGLRFSLQIIIAPGICLCPSFLPHVVIFQCLNSRSCRGWHCCLPCHHLWKSSVAPAYWALDMLSSLGL